VITERQWWGISAACGAVFAFAIAGSYCGGCTPEARAPIEHKLSDALTDEQLACMLATHAGGSADVHAGILTACAIGPEVTGFALTLLQMADRLHIGADGGGG
jgi:hypothetical protein